MSHLLTIHRLFRRLQQKNRFIGRGLQTGLTISETHFILELQADSDRSISDLTILLGLNQSTCSRIAQNLVRRGLIQVKVSQVDSRRRVLLLTKKGAAMTQMIDSGADQIIAQFSSRVSVAEISFLVKMFKAIADGYGHPAGVRRIGESLYRVEQRRITRCFGLLGEQVFNSSLTSSQWQALSEIVLSPIAPQVTELSVVLSVPQNSLSSVLESLENLELIRREVGTKDKRISTLYATSEGERLCKKIEQQAVADLERSLDRYSGEELDRFSSVLTRFVGEFDPRLPPLFPQYRLIHGVTGEQRQSARGFVARSLVKAGDESFIPEQFLAGASIFFEVESDEGTAAVIELSKAGKEIEITLGAWSGGVTPFVMLGVINQALFEIAEGRSSFLKVLIRFEPLQKMLGFDRWDVGASKRQS